MAETLGEKLRQAREERGISISEVAEQTRISPLYLESIENDDYRNLPGGIFNKGFVKSFAKYVGLNEQEALTEYGRLVSSSNVGEEAELKVYRPEVLTDDRSGGSMVPTVIVAVIILAGMTAGILFLINYIRRPSEPVTSNISAANSQPVNTAPGNTEAQTVPAGPDMATLKVEFKTTTRPVRLSATSDGTKSDNVIAAGATVTFEPKESLTLNYLRWNAPVVELFINGKQITLPTEPLNDPRGQRIEFTINKDNLAQIWQTASIGPVPPPADANTNANVAAPAVAMPVTRPTAPKPTPAANTAPANANTVRTLPTPRPAATATPRPARTSTE